MPWVVRVLALGLTMALVHRLTAAGPLAARATLALGFLFLAAHLGGHVATRLRLPRITAYLVIGFAVGPAWLGLVRAEEVGALRFIADAALALIALTAGTELKLETLRSDRIALTRLAVGAIAFPFAAVALVTLTVSPWFPLTVHQPFGDAVAVAFVLGTIAAASSPAVTMALIGEVDARGPFARAILGVTVAQDLAVVALLTLALTLAEPLSSAGALDLLVVWQALLHLSASLAAGVALGYLVAQYAPKIERGTAVFLVAIAFLAAEVAQLLHLEVILIALAAGFSLEQFSRVESARLVAELQRGSPLVYMAAFALAGAGLRVGALADMWAWIVLLTGLRALGLRYGMIWAGRHAAVSADLARFGWLGLVSQAGLALSLAAVARRAFPEWGVSLETLAVAMIGVQEVLGPILFRRALVRVGEVTEEEHVAEKPAAGDAVGVPGSGGV